MKRQQKYFNTSTFYYHNEKPKNRITGDCVYRAVATATGKPWEEVVRGLAETAIKTGYSPASSECMDKYLASLGWKKHKQPRKDDNTKYRGYEFCKYLEQWSDPYIEGHIEGSVIANIGGHHVVAFVEEDHGWTRQYRCWDIWNSTGKCIGNYWYKTED